MQVYSLARKKQAKKDGFKINPYAPREMITAAREDKANDEITQKLLRARGAHDNSLENLRTSLALADSAQAAVRLTHKWPAPHRSPLRHRRRESRFPLSVAFANELLLLTTSLH